MTDFADASSMTFNALYTVRFELTFFVGILAVWAIRSFAANKISRTVRPTTAAKQTPNSPISAQKSPTLAYATQRPTVLARGAADASASDLCNPAWLIPQVSQLCRSQWQIGLKVYRSARKAGLDLQNMSDMDCQELLMPLVTSAIRVGSADEAVQILQDLHQDRSGIHTSLFVSAVKLCTSKQLFGHALSIYKLVAKDTTRFSDKSVWSCLLFSAVESKSYDLCKLLFENIKACGSPSAKDFGNMIRFAAAKSDWELGLQITQTMQEEGIEVDKVTYNHAIALCVSADQVDKAHQLLTQMENVSGAADAITYNVLMNGYAKTGSMDRCFDLLSHMRSKQVSPTQVTYGILLDACINEGKLDRASEIFDRMHQEGCTMNTVLYTTLIKGFARAGEVERAMEVYDQMRLKPTMEPDIITFSTLIKANCDSSRLEAAAKLVEQMKQLGMKPDEVIFNNLLTGCCRQSNLSLGSSIYSNMLASGVKPSNATFSILIRLYAESKHLEGAVEMMKRDPSLQGVEPEPRLFMQLAQSCIRDRQGRRVIEVYDMMAKCAQPSAANHGALLATCTKLNMFDTAAEILEIAASSGGRVNAKDANSVLEMAMKKRKGTCAKSCLISMQRLNLPVDKSLQEQAQRLE